MKRLFFPILFFLYGVAVNGQPALLKGEILNTKDSLKLVLKTNPIIYESQTIFIVPGNGIFQQEINLKQPCFFYLKVGQDYVNGLLEPGDQPTIKCNSADVKNTLSFEGKGSEKLTFLTSLYGEKIFSRAGWREQLSIAKTKQNPFDYLLNYLDDLESEYAKKLELIKSNLSREGYLLLEAELKAKLMGYHYHAVTDVYGESVSETLEKRKNELSAGALALINALLSFDDAYSISPNYVNAVYNILFVHYQTMQFEHKAGSSITEKYSYLNKLLPPNLKVPVLTMFLDYDIGVLNQSEELEHAISTTYRVRGDSVYRNFIVSKFNQTASFRKGEQAPDFVLEDRSGKTISLSSLKGKVIYMDFWYAACVPCHALFQTMKPVKEYFKNNEKVIFLNISTDKKDVWEKALTKYNIDGYHVYTQNREQEHGIIKAYRVVAYPTTCLIDKKGNIFAANPASNSSDLIKQIENALGED